MNWLEKLIELIAMAPGTFWGVLIGSFFSLGGVMLSNRASDRRLRAQFEYERELRINDSELALRKDVYLAATEAISAGLQSVGKMADLETPNNAIAKEYIEKAPAMAKIHVIGNDDTLAAVINVSNELSKAIMQLTVKRALLLLKKQELDQLNKRITDFGKERDRMIELMKQYNLEGLVDQRLWKTIDENFEFEQNRISEELEQLRVLSVAFVTDQLDFTEECVGEVFRLGRLAVPTVVAIRKELNIPMDESVYERIIEESYAKQTANLTQFLEQMRAFAIAQSGPAQDDPDKTPVS